MRNVCEGHEGNQRFVESLKPQQVLHDDALKSHGISIEIDPQSGRFKYHQDEGAVTK